MIRTISTEEIESQFDQIIQDVISGDNYIIERDGQPVAVLVPMALYAHWETERAAFFAQMQEVAARANLDPDEAERLVNEAVQAVRTVPPSV